MQTINITRHPATKGQKADGVYDLPAHTIEQIKKLCIFQPVPSLRLLRNRAEMVVDVLDAIEDKPTKRVMCGGAPYFNSILDKALISRGYIPVYPFTIRSSSPSGATIEYVHLGLVPTV